MSIVRVQRNVGGRWRWRGREYEIGTEDAMEKDRFLHQHAKQVSERQTHQQTMFPSFLRMPYPPPWRPALRTPDQISSTPMAYGTAWISPCLPCCRRRS